MKIEIFLNYFADAYKFESDCLIPIQVGRRAAKQKLDMLGDDSGENISEKNAQYCELTGHYYVWKNRGGADYYGFLHYRRLFDFSANPKHEPLSHGAIPVERARELNLAEYGLTPRQIEAALNDVDIVVPFAFDVGVTGATSVRVQYLLAPFHDVAHLDLAGKIIERIYPEDSKYFVEAMKGKELYPNNMFVMRAALFEKYSAWLFAILFELEKSIDVVGLPWQAQRAVGYIAERLFTVFVIKLRAESEYKIKYLHRVFIADTTTARVAPPAPKTQLPVVTIAASTDAAYAQHMAALIASTLSHAARDRYIDFIVLDGGLSITDRRRLGNLARLHPNCRVEFVDMSKEYLDVPTNAYFTRGTFYRLSLPELILDRDKILFLDTDMVVLRDVAPLFDTDVSEFMIGAAGDLIMRAFSSMGVVSLAEAGGVRTARYLTDTIGLSNSQKYFQAGVLLFNLAEMRRTEVAKKMVHALRTEFYWFLDQDVLNKFCAGRVCYIDSRWNTVFMDDFHLKSLPAVDQKEYQRTQDDPWIVHYAGTAKPWINNLHPFAFEYWGALKHTSWYESALFAYATGLSGAHNNDSDRHGYGLVRKSISLWIARRVWRALPKSVKRRLVPLGTAIKRKVAVEG